ncbi:hypothetical protein CRE_31282 [Caenorhabditis remanei]|uniref:SCP domain-containing protein n=1 Tax=Caenorhabditis remanei TaxID=31234 RepID=E3MLM5_CAERE|nr:hypothetical protein CRE_31282 [Caenorhabditis remanei]
MKPLLLVFLFVFSAVSADELDKFNNLRRGFAKSNAMPDMWELTSSKELLDIASHIECPTKPGANWRFFYLNGGKNARDYDNFLIEWFKKFEKTNASVVTAQVKEWEKGTAYFLEYVNPIQTKLACVDKQCTIESTDLNIKINYRRMCLFGPNNYLGMTMPIDEKSGKVPGSKCGPNGKNNDGLCVPK